MLKFFKGSFGHLILQLFLLSFIIVVVLFSASAVLWASKSHQPQSWVGGPGEVSPLRRRVSWIVLAHGSDASRGVGGCGEPYSSNGTTQIRCILA